MVIMKNVVIFVAKTKKNALLTDIAGINTV